MRKSPISSCLAVCGLILSAYGCLSVSNSPVSRFYTLQSVETGKDVRDLKVAPGTVIAIGPVNIPDYLNRPQIVSIDKNKMLHFAEFDRWGEPVDSAISRLVNENLARIFPEADIEMYPWNMNVPVRYQVLVNVIRMDCDLDDALVLLAQWSLIDQKTKAMVVTKRFNFSQAVRPQSYAGLTMTLSRACADLSYDMAQAISYLPGQEGNIPAAPENK